MKKIKTMRYKLNLETLYSERESQNIRELITRQEKRITAILYLIQVMDISINDELYNSLPDDVKQYFKGANL